MVKTNRETYILIGVLTIALLVAYKYNSELSCYIKMFDIPFYIPRKSNTAPRTISDVPLVIYESWELNRVPENMKNNIYSLLKSNPEFDYYLYSDDDCYNFIKENFNKDVLDAFVTLKPGAYKSDLWRYCILYKKGGVYMDIKYNTIKPLVSIIKDHPIIYVNDRQIPLTTIKNCLYNAFMVSPPNNPVFKDCIDEIVDNCNNKKYGKNPLDVTGPCLLSRKVSKYDKNYFKNNKFNFQESFNVLIFDTRIGYICYENKKLLKTYPEYRMEQELKQSTEHYGSLWAKGNIYNI
jgi:mannosyltransferase OCH1-like enzyme